MQIQALGHVVLKVRDLERSIAFYSGVLGLPVVAREVVRGFPIAFFAFTGTHHDFALMQTGPDAPVAPDDAPGLAHVAFRIGENLDTLRAAYAHLRAHGVAVDQVADHSVSQSLYVRDPDDNWIELYVDADPRIWRDDPAQVARSDTLEL